MEPETLFQSPFTDMHEESAYGYFIDSQVLTLVSAIRSVNANAMPMHQLNGKQ
jgi:type I restriction enzyme R subunit